MVRLFFLSLRYDLMKARLLARLGAASLSCTACLALAHEGHGIEGASHWHATDTLGLLVGTVVVGLAVWFTRGGK